MLVKGRLVFMAVSALVLTAVFSLAAGGAGGSGEGLYRLVGLFGHVVALVRGNYVEEVPVERLEMGAVSGLVERADPGGMWIPAEFQPAFETAFRREAPPFGLVLGKRSSYPYILEVIPGSPAAEAGVQAGELIERIGEESVRARPLWVSQVLLDKAERETGAAQLDVIDRALQGKRLVSLESREVVVPGPEVRIEDGVPVIRPWRLDEAAVAQVRQALAPHRGQPGVVVDLRGVALGSAQEAVKLAAEVAGGTVELRAVQRQGKGERLRARGPQRAWRVVVCIDSTTAGPGEVAALALSSRGATLVGLETFGDTGRRQSSRVAGGYLWLAQSWFAGPEGDAILGSGVQPDELVRMRRDRDTIMQRALELAVEAEQAEAA